MIKPNELRIGNALEYFVEDSLAESEWILNIVDADDIALACKDEYFNKYYRPIPLTPEILEKCGFEKIESQKQYGWYISIGNRELCWCYADYISLEFKVGQLDDFGDTIKDINCKYLHQLQNLYFALTGEELTFKP